MRALGLMVLAAVVACGDGPTALNRDVLLARQAWAALDARDYSFDLTTTSMAGVRTRHVTVVDRLQVAEDPESLALYASVTVDDLWQQILAARDHGDLNEARFDVRGVPVIADMGYWPLDGGVRYQISNFVKTR